MTDNRTTELLPCPICGKKVYIGLYDDGRGYWWMVHGGMHYDECHCRLFMESCRFELEDDMRVDYDEHAMGVRGGLARRWNTRAERTCHGESDLSEWVCSNCQCWIPLGLTPDNIKYASEWRYCPHCGAKVVSDDDR